MYFNRNIISFLHKAYIILYYSHKRIILTQFIPPSTAILKLYAFEVMLEQESDLALKTKPVKDSVWYFNFTFPLNSL